ncbi:hypothetical protein [Flavobacterium magnesitis]|uniref:hypothetical protein n=1 Tax=Flavobacterium magnesitis TaxID=3138077 RepID=UPI00358E86EE
MFKNTNKFFKKVATGNVSHIDIKTYIKQLTENHKIELLKTLQYDWSFFKYLFIENIESKITDEVWNEKFTCYKETGVEMPKIKIENVMRKLKKLKGLPYEDEPEFNEYFDKEKIFYPYELFSINQVEKYIDKLIIENENIENSTPKHENIFSNNGFKLFEHILNEYVKPKGTKGRLSDIHFFYWSMFNHEPQLIHQRPEPFKSWFFKHYQNEDLGKIKTYLQVEDPNRKKHFSNALDWFKTQSF